jgi:hypothetical protein
MKAHRIIYAGVLLGAALIAQVHAAEFNLSVSAGGAVPVGDFGKKTDIIGSTSGSDSYSAVGGAAETGFGFDVELEAGVARRVFVGGTFGYSRHSADAKDLIESGIPSLASLVKGVDAAWTFSCLGGFVRVVALESPTLSLYGKLGIGMAKVKNTFDVTLDLGPFGESTFTSDFNLGNQIYLTGGLGGEYRVFERVWLVGEVRLKHVNTDGAEATAHFSEYEITGAQNFNTRSLDIMAGLRFPLSGI